MAKIQLKSKLEQLRRTNPKRSRYGQLYSKLEQTKKRYKKVTLFTLFISDENTHLLRPHVFRRSAAITPKEWSAHFSANLEDINARYIIPGMNNRTNKFWKVQQIIGWVGGDAIHRFDNARARGARNNTRKKRRANG